MIQTGDSKKFNKGNTAEADDSSRFAQPKGVQTRAAIATHLAKKLKIADQGLNIDSLMEIEKQMRQGDVSVSSDQFWEEKLTSERKRLQEIR